ncbi:MAG TPA: TonB family protein [Candidatus Aminicenantes bacterium]|nr:TonB family protein [Candidatus Aminicenantes bacterium]HQJ42095.1 TonB family protein [Candidatus Aminicenantes bacterium]
MTWSAAGSDRAFKRALIISAAGHVILFSFIILNPSLPKKPSPKGVIHYISMGMVGGGGGGRGGGGDGRLPGGGNKAAGGTTAVSQSKPESLRDLTVPEKVVPKTESRLRYPVDDKTKRKAAAEKRASISKPGPGGKAGASGSAAGTGGGGEGGTGLTIGPGGAGSGGGFGEGFGDGLAEFPYAYYLLRVRDEITVNWFPGSIDPGPNNVLQTLVYFRIYRNGSISTIEIKQSSGLRAFDLIAVRAVTNAAHFPPLPDDYDGEYLGINLLFEHAR